jgi:hypothetical protein
VKLVQFHTSLAKCWLLIVVSLAVRSGMLLVDCGEDGWPGEIPMLLQGDGDACERRLLLEDVA